MTKQLLQILLKKVKKSPLNMTINKHLLHTLIYHLLTNLYTIVAF